MEEVEEPALIARPDGLIEAAASTQWPGGPQGEPSSIQPGPAENELFTPEQMRRLDEWTAEAPLIHATGAATGHGGFEGYIQRSNEGMQVERQLALAAQQLALPGPAGDAEGPRPAQRQELGPQLVLLGPGGHLEGSRLAQWQDQGTRQQPGLPEPGRHAQWPDPMQEMRYYMAQILADNRRLHQEVGQCLSQVQDMQQNWKPPEVEATRGGDQSDRFATPEEHGTPEGRGTRGEPADPEEESSELREDEPTGPKDKSLDIMLKIVQGMQNMQQQMLDTKKKVDHGDDTSETVKNVTTDLPKLVEYKPESAPIDLGDWICVLEPIMADLSESSQQWWQKVVESARRWYGRYQTTPPLERLKLQPKDPPELQEPKWRRLERRAVGLLLRALPDGAREEMVATKSMTCYAILCKLMASYQPGGLVEKSVILKNLESPPEVDSLASLVVGLRKWMRWKQRAQELGVTIPDPTVLARSLSKMVKKVVEMQPELSFKMALARNSLQLDSIPSHEAVEKYAEHVLSEVEAIAHLEKEVKAPAGKAQATDTRIKKAEAVDSKNEVKSAGEGGKPCKFFLTEKGCRRGRGCRWSHDQKDERMRCWSCGASEHMRKDCPVAIKSNVDRKPKAAKVNAEEETKKDVGTESQKVTTPRASMSATVQEDSPGAASSASGDKETDAMKDVLQEATKMLRSINVKTGKNGPEDDEKKLMELQKQLDGMREKMRVRQVRLSKMEIGGMRGLVDSGATHPLRPMMKGEDTSDYEEKTVELAAGETYRLKVTLGGTLVAEDERIQPIIPMGMLTKDLNCQVKWSGKTCAVVHPGRGRLPVVMSQGCPELPRELALSLIQELEGVNRYRVKALSKRDEVDFIKKVVETHPVFDGVPGAIKEKLMVNPAEDWKPPGLNRSRRRRLEKKGGAIVHLFAGPEKGFDLSRAYKEQGGDPRDILEYDILRDNSHDLMDDELMGGLVRLALDDRIKAVVGGPNCRTRSVLRFFPLLNRAKPRPVRTVEYPWGLPGMDQGEEAIVYEDDVLMFRFILVYLLADLTAKAREEKGGAVEFFLEQPAEPQAEPRCASWWRTPEWEALEKLHELKKVTFLQGDWGGRAAKPTTIGTTMDFRGPEKGICKLHQGGHQGQEQETDKPRWMMTDEEKLSSSKALARWAPGMMRELARCLRKEVDGESRTKVKALSWEEHVKLGHLPFRRDCRVCQEASAKDRPHRRVRHPAGNVLSVDLSGPFIKGIDVDGVSRPKVPARGCVHMATDPHRRR